MSTTGRDNIRRDVRWIAAAAAILLGNILVYMRYPGRILRFYRRLGYLPNVCDPKSKNEKFLWRKTFDRNPMYRILADKLAWAGPAPPPPIADCRRLSGLGRRPNRYRKPFCSLAS